MAVTSRAEEKDGGLLARFRQNDGGYGTRLAFGGLGAVIIASFVLNAIWGAQMAFPFDVGHQIGGEIDDAIRWVTREGAFILGPDRRRGSLVPGQNRGILPLDTLAGPDFGGHRDRVQSGRPGGRDLRAGHAVPDGRRGAVGEHHGDAGAHCAGGDSLDRHRGAGGRHCRPERPAGRDHSTGARRDADDAELPSIWCPR